MNIFKSMALYGFRRAKEIVHIAIIRAWYFLKGDYDVPPGPEFPEFKADLEALSPERRTDGISGFYRVKNEERFLRASVKAHLPYLDEIIIVYNDCSDKTPEIARALEKEYPDKVKVYEYLPKVHPALSVKHVITPANSVHSLVNYYNFALSKTTRKIAVKIDSDHIPVLPQFADAVSDIRKNNPSTMLYFYGVNIYMEDGKAFINRKNPFTHGFDCGFFPVSRSTYFVHRLDCESLSLPLRMYFSRRPIGVLFYHLKGVKEDKGLGYLDPNMRDNKEIRKMLDEIRNPDLIPWLEAAERYPAMLERVPEPKFSGEIL